MDKYVGKKLDGRYDIRELIGIGGMANVYRCYDTIDEREVAIKILKDEYLNNDEFIRRFKNESKAIAVLSHPNIVKVFDVSFGDMIQYIVMEYIDGITLKEYIQQQGVLTWKETVHLISQVLAALSHAHGKGVVHRDIKPQNMMLLPDGTIKVTDFGIARFSNNTKTMTEQAIGSVHYIAPEQAKGDITDGRTDIYSLGIMMYEMLTGKLPFDGDNAVSVALMHLQLNPDIPTKLNPQIPEGLEEITLKAIQKQPSDRYQSAQDMLSDIESFRLNPSVKFEYKYMFDKQPTRYVEAINKVKSNRFEKPENEKIRDDDDVKHNSVFAAVLGVVIGLVVAVACSFLVYLFSTNNTSSASFGDVDVPNFIGMDYHEVIENPNYHFEFSAEYVSGKEAEINEIVDQYPLEGSKKIKENGKITLIINSKLGEGVIPDIYGKDYPTARQMLENADFTNIEICEIIDENGNEGTVKVSYPAQGATVEYKQTVYLYVVSDNADNRISVPYCVDCDVDTLEESLTKLGFKVDIKEKYSPSPAGTVLSQSPAGGKIAKGQEITLTVSNNQTEVPLTLPANLENDTHCVITRGNSVIYDQIINSNAAKSFSLKIPGEGVSDVVITLNGFVYSTINVDFDSKKVNNIQVNPYDPNPTEPETQPTEEVTDVTEPSEQ